jgi:predicted dehydrogenase
VRQTERVAVIGCGHWGRNLVRTFASLGALGAVVDPSDEARANASRLSPEVRLWEHPEDVLADPEIDAVAIATPAETHYKLASLALAAGKHVFVEKPITLEVDDARGLVAQAQAEQRTLMVGHLLRYHPAIKEIERLAREGALGKIRYIVSNRLNLGKIRTEENALWSFAPHDIAVILALVGRLPCEVVATGGSYVQPNIADVTVTQLLFDNGIRSHVFVSWLHPFKEQRLVVIGSRRMVTFDDVAKELQLYDLQVNWEDGEPVPVRAPGVPVPYSRAEPLLEECLHFLDCIRKGERPRTDGESGLAVLRILDAAQRSMARNGSAIPIGA